MASGIKLSISMTGDTELLHALDQLEPKAAKKVVKGALKSAARKMRSAARANAPRRQGDLRRSIKTKQMKAKVRVYGTYVLTSSRSMPDKFYAANVDLGHRSVEPVEFMEDAFDFNVDDAARAITTDLWAGVLEAWQ